MQLLFIMLYSFGNLDLTDKINETFIFPDATS